MATINFYLKQADKNGQCPIMLTYQNKGKKFRYYTKLKAPISAWKDQRIKQNYTGHAEINSILDDFENTLKSIEREALFQKKTYSIEVIQKKFFLKLGLLRTENDFISIFNKFVEESRATKVLGTIKNYEATKSKMIEFCQKKKIDLAFDLIDTSFYELFVNYMLDDEKLLNNTVGKHIKTLKVFLYWALDHQYTNKDFGLKKFKVFREEPDIIYLTEPELMSLYNLADLSERLSAIRDVFCFACFTGLRFSDVSRLGKIHLRENFIEIKTQKTRDFVKIPMNYLAKGILSRYSFSDSKILPTGISNQKTNEYLKELGKKAGISELVSIEKFSGSKKISEPKKKFELITTHTARRTFVTLSLEKGVRAEVVMAMTGHKSYNTFKRYIKITETIMQQEMNRIWNDQLKVV